MFSQDRVLVVYDNSILMLQSLVHLNVLYVPADVYYLFSFFPIYLWAAARIFILGLSNSSKKGMLSAALGFS